MDQMLVAAFFLVNAFAFTAGYYIGSSERKSRNPAHIVHSGRDDVETRARRAF
jgi:hypothetical protein